MMWARPAVLAAASVTPSLERSLERLDGRSCAAESSTVNASICGASSPKSHPAKKVGTAAFGFDGGRRALAVRAATMAWRRR